MRATPTHRWPTAKRGRAQECRSLFLSSGSGRACVPKMISWDILIAIAGAGLLAEIFDPSLPVFVLISLLCVCTWRPELVSMT
jgi:hypothetical protein